VPAAHREGELRLGQWIGVQRLAHGKGQLSSERVAALESLGMVWDAQEESFQQGLAALRTYVAREGHARVPKTYREGDLRLGAWINQQRVAHGKGQLAPERMAALEALDMVWDALEESFQQNLAALRTYVAREGHARVPAAHREGELRLGQWIGVQRLAHGKGQLSSERVAALESLGMVWGVAKDFFEQNLAALRTYVAREGHARVPKTYREGELRLGQWIGVQRVAHGKGQLAPERMAALEALGMVWDAQEETFQQNLAALRTYVAREGHARVPQSHREGELRLGKWVAMQRVAYGKGALAPERVAALEALGMVWQVNKKRKQD
jgi:hypothetical protein